MTLKHCIIHKIERKAPGNDIITEIRQQENNSSGPIYSLIEQLKQSYQRSSQKQYGHFDQTRSDNPIPQWLQEHQSGKSTFPTISLRIIEHFQEKLGSTDEVFSFHLVIAFETVLDQDLLYIFWVPHVDATHVNSDLEVASSQFIDTRKLHYATKVYLHEWLEENSQKYLSMVMSRGNKNLSDAFSNSIGFSTGLDLAEDTSEFLGILDQYAKSIPEEKVSEYKGKVLDYCIEQDKNGNPVVFDDISSQLDESAPENFSSFVSDHQQTPKTEIYTDRSSLKRYVRYFGRDNTMSISFSSEMFGEDIIYDPQSGSLTIKRIPKSLKQQLQRRINPPSADSPEESTDI
ncbi:MAG: nucleoid-associated protein [Oceanicoccus sp.]|jgi:nucleoid-associated protein